MPRWSFRRAPDIPNGQHALKPIIRRASVADLEYAEGYKERAKEALMLCRNRVHETALAMNPINVDFTLDGQKAIFYFTAAERVDFRSLVRYLAGRLKRQSKCGKSAYATKPRCSVVMA